MIDTAAGTVKLHSAIAPVGGGGVAAIPTLGEWGRALLALLLAGAATLRLRRGGR